MDSLTNIAAMAIYSVLAILALWGALCVVLAWRRVAMMRFASEQEQFDFLTALEQPLENGRFDEIVSAVEDDDRALPRLVGLALVNRQVGYAKVRQLVLDRFQRDVLADLENRVAWVHTVIKSAPMVGLLGTVIGMMGAFAKLSAGEKVDPSVLANDISVALITTASGLAIAIPLVMATTVINVRMRQMEDLISSGLTRFLEVFRDVVMRVNI